MPELPEVETVVRTLRTQIVGQRIQSVKVLWPRTVYEDPEFAASVTGQRIHGIQRRGKYLIFQLDHGYFSVHLRMEGRFFLTPIEEEPKKHTHVVFNLDQTHLEFNDTRKFGRIRYSAEHPTEKELANLGIEPFDEALTPAYCLAKARSRQLPLKTFLLDQSVIAGLGNIYSDEVCFLAKLSPLKPVKDVTETQWQELIGLMRMVLSEAILAGGATVRSYTASLGITGRFQTALRVYGRSNQACIECGQPLTRTVIGQRSSVYCGRCQEN
jgi:formamidopyrimidine-DNA glycosylase